MTLVVCSLCCKAYRRTPDNHRAFCAACVVKITADGAAAEAHMQRIKAGDMKAIPDNETQRNVRDAERRRQVRALT